MCAASHGLALTLTLTLIIFEGEEGEDADLEAPKIYEPIESFDQLSEKLQQYQAQYNETVRGGKMDLVFFKVSLDHRNIAPKMYKQRLPLVQLLVQIWY